MRFVLVRRVESAEKPGSSYSREFAARLRVYDETLTRAGVLLSAGRLHHESQATHIAYRGGEAVVIDRPPVDIPFIAGFWLIQTRDRAEAIEWARRVPVPIQRGGAGIEVWQCASRP